MKNPPAVGAGGGRTRSERRSPYISRRRSRRLIDSEATRRARHEQAGLRVHRRVGAGGTATVVAVPLTPPAAGRPREARLRIRRRSGSSWWRAPRGDRRPDPAAEWCATGSVCRADRRCARGARHTSRQAVAADPPRVRSEGSTAPTRQPVSLAGNVAVRICVSGPPSPVQRRRYGEHDTDREEMLRAEWPRSAPVRDPGGRRRGAVPAPARVPAPAGRP